MKRNLIIILVVLLTAIAGYIYFTKDQVVFSKETSLYKAVPLSAPAFVEISSIRSIPVENPVLKELAGIKDFGWILEEIKEIDSSIKGDKEIQNQLAKKPFLLAFDFIGENVLSPLLITELRTADELKGFEKLLSKVLGVPVTSFQNRKYDGHRIVDVVLTENKKEIHYCAVSGLLILSPEPILVEKSIRQLSAQNLTDVHSFSQVNKTVTSQSDFAWYINHNRFPELWANYLNPKTESAENEFGETVKTNLKRDVRGIRNYASWTELDLTLKEDLISLNGITVADDSLNHFLSVFNGQDPVNCQADRMLPRNTSFFAGFTFSDKDLFYQNLEQYFVLSNSYFSREAHMKEIEKRFGKGSRNILKNLVKNHVIAAITTPPGDNSKATSLFIVNNDSRNENRQQFESLLQNYAGSKKIEVETLTSDFKTREGKTVRVYRFPYPSLPGIWLGKMYSFVEANYAAFHDNHLVFASSESALEQYVNDLESGNTLKNDLNYSRFKQSIENAANLSVYLNINQGYSFNEVLFNSEIAKGFEENQEIFRKFGALSWQVLCEKDIFFNSINLSFSSRPKSDARSSWSVNLGAEISSKPQIVINHGNKTENEVVVQDNNNKLHLVGADGKIIWSAPINGKILGEIHQIDYYRNGKLQYLFNTKEKLYLLDRDGKFVANFPIVFKSPATNGINVFDYDNNRKYRYFVACENRKVYAYDHEGKIITGWKFGQTNGVVTTPVQHFRVDNKDYIVFKDDKKVYIQNRRGETRVNPSVSFEPSKNAVILDMNNTPKMVVSDKNGKVYYLYFDGKYAEKNTGHFSKDHFFTASDLDGNGITDFVFTDGNEMTVMNENGKKLFSNKFDHSLDFGANLYSFSAKQKEIGVTDVKENEIYLYAPNGKLHAGFPLKGNSEFSIGSINNQNLSLLVGSKNGELLSYTLE